MRSSVPLAEVAKEPFICHDPDNPLQRFVEETFHAAGINHLNRFLTFGSTEAVKAGVESSLGVSILSLYTITKACPSSSSLGGQVGNGFECISVTRV